MEQTQDFVERARNVRRERDALVARTIAMAARKAWCFLIRPVPARNATHSRLA